MLSRSGAQTGKDERRTHKPEFLSYNRKYEVRVVLWQEVQLGLGGFVPTARLPP